MWSGGARGVVKFSRQAVAWLVAFGNAVIHSVTAAEKILNSRGWHQWQIVRFSDYIIKLFYLLSVICWSLRREFGFTQWIPADPMILLSREVCASVAWHHSEYLGAQWVFRTTVLMSGENIRICYLLFCIFLRKKLGDKKNAISLCCSIVPLFLASEEASNSVSSSE